MIRGLLKSDKFSFSNNPEINTPNPNSIITKGILVYLQSLF